MATVAQTQRRARKEPADMTEKELVDAAFAAFDELDGILEGRATA